MRIALIVSMIFGFILCMPARADYTPEEVATGLKWCKERTEINQITDNACAGYRAANAELRLTRAYANLRALLKKHREPDAVAHLLKVQRAWIAFREGSCESQEQGTLASSLFAGCMETMADERASDLEQSIQGLCEEYCPTESSESACKVCGA